MNIKGQSFVFIKPDGVRRNLTGEIIGRFEKAGLKITRLEMTEVEDDVINKHYPLNNYDYVLTLGHVDVSNFTEEEKKARYDKNYRIIKNLQDYVTSGPIVKMIISGPENTVELVRGIVGKTDPAASAKGTIRGDLGEDSFEQSDKEGRAVYNLIHASGSSEEAEEEIYLWFKE
ncbi:MAG: nucleoside-diphosphate kinase [Armatimonadetes bacterium]|nr:MAG: nucleoside-diphosphate kinase [Armatimonadota bacterium]